MAYDDYGREIESVGYCLSEDQTPFVASIFVINGCALLLALWQAYLARNIKTEYSESSYIGMAMVCIFEAW